MDKRPDDKYVAYRKVYPLYEFKHYAFMHKIQWLAAYNCLLNWIMQGLGVVCNKEGGFAEDDFVVEFLGEVWLQTQTHTPHLCSSIHISRIMSISTL